ncbi:hypothetical protein AYO41_05010 [Verrucomicrobia bacterium SCGC AG-212-E04]|nr:hypothetical protein AYO41_05010 [Verrucomicrobia bacterium SCGC AG-212-E04]
MKLGALVCSILFAAGGFQSALGETTPAPARNGRLTGVEVEQIMRGMQRLQFQQPTRIFWRNLAFLDPYRVPSESDRIWICLESCTFELRLRGKYRFVIFTNANPGRFDAPGDRKWAALVAGVQLVEGERVIYTVPMRR